MQYSRKKITILSLSLLFLVILIIFGIFAKHSITASQPVTDFSSLPSDAFTVAKKYIETRESSVDATHATPQAWTQNVQSIVTPSLYATISKGSPEMKASYDAAHKARFIVQATVSSCSWNAEAGSHTNTQGAVVCGINDKTLYQSSGAVVPFESFPAGWNYTGRYLRTIALIKQNGVWLVNKDTDGEEAEVTPTRHNINFQGIDPLINQDGVATSQIDALEQAFYTFAPSVQTVTVKNISTISRDPTDGHFSVTFAAMLNNIPYNAIINYSGLNNLQLILTNSQGKVVYDSGDIDGSTITN